jgi:acyl carrier protein
MIMDNFLRQVEEIVELESGTAQPSDRFKEYPTWDSLAFLVLLTQISEEYGVTVSNSELTSIDTLEELWSMIRKKKG